jgi:hypothetical protein
VRATTTLALARAREAAGDAVGASRDVAAAADLLARLDVVMASADAETIRRLGIVVAPPAATLCRDGKWWTATSNSTTVRVADSKGLRYLAELLRTPGTERHALGLVDGVEGTDPGIDRRALGDAGPVLDGRARAVYRARIEELHGEIAEATMDGRHDQAEAMQAELEQVVAELARAFGLGGRDRRAASAAEQARLNVTRALRTAITRLSEVLPDAAALDRGTRTGLYCCYDPADGDIRWIVQS